MPGSAVGHVFLTSRQPPKTETKAATSRAFVLFLTLSDYLSVVVARRQSVRLRLTATPRCIWLLARVSVHKSAQRPAPLARRRGAFGVRAELRRARLVRGQRMRFRSTGCCGLELTPVSSTWGARATNFTARRFQGVGGLRVYQRDPRSRNPLGLHISALGFVLRLERSRRREACQPSTWRGSGVLRERKGVGERLGQVAEVFGGTDLGLAGPQQALFPCVARLPFP